MTLAGPDSGRAASSSATGRPMARAPHRLLGIASRRGARWPPAPAVGRRPDATSISARRSTTPTRATTSRRSSGSTPSSPSTTALDEPALDSLHHHINDAEFSVGDFELNYRMHHRAGRAIKAVLEANVDEAVRNEAAYPAGAHPLPEGPARRTRCTRSTGSRARCPRRSATTSSSCARTSTWPLGRPARRGRGARSSCRAPTTLTGFAAYNLGIALLQDGRRARRHRAARQGRAGQGRRPRRRARSATSRTSCSARCCFEAADFGARGAVARPRAPRGTVLEPGAAARGLGRRVGGALRPRARAVEHPRRSASRPTPRCRKRMLAVPYAYAQARTCTAARRVLYGRARRVVRRSRSNGRRLDRAASAKGEFLRRWCARRSARTRTGSIRLRSLPDAPETYLPDGADGVARLPDGAAELPRPRGPAHEAGRVAGELRRLRGPDPAARAHTTSRCCPRSTRSSASSTRRCACGSSSASTSTERLQHHADRAAARTTSRRRTSGSSASGSPRSSGSCGSASGPEALALRAAARAPAGRADLAPARPSTTSA